MSRSAVTGAMLVCLLIVAEALTVVHALDFDAHRLDEPCKICISLAGAGSAPPANPPTLLQPPAAGEGLDLDRSVLLGLRRLERPAVRGPPSVS